MSAVTVFQVKFTLEFTSLTMNLSLNRMSFKIKQAHPQRANGKGKKAISESTVNNQLANRNHVIRSHFRAKQTNQLFLYVQKSTDNGYFIQVDNKNSRFIPEQRKKRLNHFLKICIRKNNKWFSAQGKTLWSNIFHLV